MKLLRYGPKGQEKPGLLDRDGRIRCLSGLVSDIDGTLLADGLDALRAIDPSTLPLVDNDVRRAEPVARVGKFICIGLNYSDHAAESGMPIPSEPIIFMKATSAIIGPDDDVYLPPTSTKTDWEVELGVVIGTRSALCSDETRARSCRGPVRRQRPVGARIFSSNAAANGTRARAATRSGRSAPGW